MFSTNKQKWLVSLWHDYLLFGVRVVLEPVVVIAFIYLMYRVLSLPTWMQVVVSSLVWVVQGYGMYRLHQRMKKGLEKK